ncbi:hypothetical protein OQX63_06070 [Pedobacter sp. PF22-3]|uniref:hypothetical protein n=1 Tax=Pedobacter sp. PF22-3 TaxID=2994467 RepID=UPI0022450946|nr:hypothetical protein [Pedobacter sp. PF22-3]MCX2493029.1 hypothetical protein [Pedobacter sp. PF22-3]
MDTAIGQSHQKDLTINYSKFTSLDNFEEIKNIERLYVFNDSTLVFPAIKTEIMPKNGVLVDMPKGITNLKNLKELYLVGLFISAFDANLVALTELEKLKFSIPRNVDIDNMIADLRKFKSLKIIDISDSVVDKKQIEKLEKDLPQIKIVDTTFFK